jgi:hypothetical protein
VSAAIGLTTAQMAEFAARGVLRLDGVVPDAINRAFRELLGTPPAGGEGLRAWYGRLMRGSAIPRVPAGTPLEAAYAPGSPLRALVEVPEVRGAIESLVGPGSRLDHHFLHVTFPPRFLGGDARAPKAQHWHQDSTIDPREDAFDVQLFYFPQAVTPEMGGTRYLPGSHLRVVSEAAIARYQNVRGQRHVVCPAGSVLLAHHGLWHGGGANRSDALRFLFKIRLAPTVPQVRLWDTADLEAGPHPQRPIFWTGGAGDDGTVDAILTRPEPWFEADTSRLEYVARIRFWRRLLGDPSWDADYWLTRLENEPGRAPR